MNDFVFKNPTKLIFGRDTVQRIREEVKNNGVSRVLLLFDKGINYNSEIYDTVMRALKEIEVIESSQVSANPVLSKVYETINIIEKENLQGIVVLGGGSIIDIAKAAAVGAKYDGDVWDMLQGKGEVKAGIPIYTVFITLCESLEMSSSCVIINEEDNKKLNFTAECMYPTVSIVDPALQFSLSREQTINGAIEAMNHVFELYFNGTKNTEVIDECAEGIIRTIMRHLQILINEPDNYDSRAEIAMCYVLNEYNSIGRKGAELMPRQMVYSLGEVYDITKGALMAIIFPNWMKLVYKFDIRKFVRFADKIFEVKQGTEDERVLKAVDLLRDFYRSLGVPISLKEIGVSYDDLDKLADNVVELGSVGTLRVLDKEDILQIYKLSYE